MVLIYPDTRRTNKQADVETDLEKWQRDREQERMKVPRASPQIEADAERARLAILAADYDTIVRQARAFFNCQTADIDHATGNLWLEGENMIGHWAHPASLTAFVKWQGR